MATNHFNMTARHRISSFFTSNNSWILIVVLLYLSFNWVMTFRPENTGSMQVYLHPDKWILYGKFFGSLCLLFFPQLCYSGLRCYSRLAPSFSKALWIVVFVVWPFIIGLPTWFSDLMPLYITSEVLGIYGLILLVVELISKPKANHFRSKGILNDLTKINVEWWVLSLVFLVSLAESQLMIGMNNWDESLLYIWLQNLSKYFLYYGFYLLLTRFVLSHIGNKRGIVYLGFAILLSVMIFYALHLLLWQSLPMNQSYIDLHNGSEWVGVGAPQSFRSIYHRVLFFPFVFLVTPFALFIHGLKQMDRVKTLQKEKIQTELNLLKQQINPHFFFNTLNNVYSLSLDNSEKTSESILELSELMRYVIYKGSEETVSLQEESDYIKNYISLNKIRSKTGELIEFQTDIDTPNLQVAPLLFIILLENAFKHGIEGSEDSGRVICELKQNGNEVMFKCLNSIHEQANTSDGIGLANLRRRLELLYPNKHSLTTQLRGDEYYAQLKITV